MSSLEIWLLVSTIVGCLALILALIALRQLGLQARVTEKLLQRVMRDIATSNSGSVGMGQRLIAMEKRLESQPKTAEKIDYYKDEEFQPYSQAAQLFKMGIECDEVARRCGLSRAEASLLEMMQRNSH